MQQMIIILIPILFYLDVPPLIHAAKQKHVDIDLVHRDSVLLSHYNNSVTSRKASRSFNEVSHFNSSAYVDARYTETTMFYDNMGEYLMGLSLGESYKAFLLISPGSDLIWLNCDRREISYREDASIFKKTDRSETYGELLFTDKLCQSRGFKWPGKSRECIYRYEYATTEDYTTGIMCTERFVLGTTTSDLAFGCSDASTIKLPNHAQGMVGLGVGELSLVSQLGDKINHRFSYCMVPNFGNSKLRLGYKEENFGAITVSTLFELKTPLPYYYLKLERIRLSDKYIEIPTECRPDIIINPMVPMIHLHPTTYMSLTTIILDKVGIESTPDPTNEFNLCFQTSKFGYRFSPIMFQFGNARVDLTHGNIFVNVGDKTCLAIFPNDYMSVFGNIAQFDIQVDYDVLVNRISFTPRDCTTF